MAPKKGRSEDAWKFRVVQSLGLEVPHLSIAERAYGLWLQQGRPIGQDMANWLEAESELNRAAVFDDEITHKTFWLDLERRNIVQRGLASTFG